MDPIIYILPIPDKINVLNPSEFQYENSPSPRLIKYGFNNINDQLDLESITSIPQYRAGLNFDFENRNDNSIVSNLSVLFNTKQIDNTFAEFWEILVLFDLLKTNQTIYTTEPKTTITIIDSYQKISKQKNKFDIDKYDNNNNAKVKNNNKSLVIFKYADSNVDLDENASIQILSNNLSKLLFAQVAGASMVLQLFGLQTQTSAEIIYYLSSLYNEAYLFKPSVTSELSNSKYIVLIGLKEIVPPNSALTELSNNNDNDRYLISIGLKNIPTDIVTVIQCMNANLIPKKYNKYNQIKNFLDTKVYEGATYEQMLQKQNLNTKKWIEIFTNLDNMDNLFDDIVKKTMNKCTDYSQLIELLKQ